MTFLPGSGLPMTGAALVTEKSGKLWLLDSGNGQFAPGPNSGQCMANFRAAGFTPEAVTETGTVLAYQPTGAADGAWRDRLEIETGPDGKAVISDILFAPDLADQFSDWLVVTAADGS